MRIPRPSREKLERVVNYLNHGRYGSLIFGLILFVGFSPAIVIVVLQGTPPDDPLATAAVTLSLVTGTLSVFVQGQPSTTFLDRATAATAEFDTAEAADGPDRDQLRAQKQQATVASEFEKAMNSANRASTVTFAGGLFVALGVVATGLWDLQSGSTETDLSTGAGIARLGVITAAFVLAGQLFRRSTSLHLRGIELQRAAIAMTFVDDLGGSISDQGERDKFLRSVYHHHLTGTSPSPNQESDPISLAQLIEVMMKTPK